MLVHAVAHGGVHTPTVRESVHTPTVRESALKVDSRTGKSNPLQPVLVQRSTKRVTAPPLEKVRPLCLPCSDSTDTVSRSGPDSRLPHTEEGIVLRSLRHYLRARSQGQHVYGKPRGYRCRKRERSMITQFPVRTRGITSVTSD